MNAGRDYVKAKGQAQANANYAVATRWLHGYNGVWWISKEPVVDAEVIEPEMGDPVCLGEGGLNWDGRERRSDRYGTVGLLPILPTTERDAEMSGAPVGSLYPNGDALRLDVPAALVNRRGRLVADVIETRQSGHIGDLFRGLFPETPKVGERILLGVGRLFLEHAAAVGLRPDDGRDHDWLDPHALYRAHSQTVRLYFEPLGKQP